jgi:heme-degrading monooxygenase HmoA
MEKTGQSYRSGEWLVQTGSEEEFVSRWNTYIEWALNNAPGARSFVLVRSTEEPRRFLSLGAWANQEAQELWREMPRTQELLSQCRELCEAFETHFYTLAASPSSPRSGTEQAAGTVQEGVTATGQTASGLLGAATGALSDVTGRTVEATASGAERAAEGAERAAEAVVFPIEGYDEMNVDEISGRLDDLSVEELQVVRDYEELNKRRESLLERMDRKIRAA